MDHPPYSSDLGPCEFWLFQNLKLLWGDRDLLTFLISKATWKVTARYCGERFSRMFPAVVPSCHVVHSFTRRVFRRRQQPLVHKETNFPSQEHSEI
jgi:hypothetical protein